MPKTCPINSLDENLMEEKKGEKVTGSVVGKNGEDGLGGELLEDGDESVELPDQPPGLSPEELAGGEDEATVEELQRMIEMGVLRKPEVEGENMEEIPLLATKLVMDWRWCDQRWKRRARLVARDSAWCDPNRTDVFTPAGAIHC